MNLTKYTWMRFGLYFAVFAVLILVCSSFYPGTILGKWYTIGSLAVILTVVEFFVIGNKQPYTQCLQKAHFDDIRKRLTERGYKLTDNKVDRLIFLKRVNLIKWDIARIVFKQNCLELEVDDEEAQYFTEWCIGRKSSTTPDDSKLQ